MAQKAVVNRPGRKKVLGVYFRNNWQLYLLLLIPVIFVIVFKYAAYPGLRMAFMNYKPAKGYAGSKWVGWETFEKIFRARRPPGAEKLAGLQLPGSGHRLPGAHHSGAAAQ